MTLFFPDRTWTICLSALHGWTSTETGELSLLVVPRISFVLYHLLLPLVLLYSYSQVLLLLPLYFLYIALLLAPVAKLCCCVERRTERPFRVDIVFSPRFFKKQTLHIRYRSIKQRMISKWDFGLLIYECTCSLYIYIYCTRRGRSLFIYTILALGFPHDIFPSSLYNPNYPFSTVLIYLYPLYIYLLPSISHTFLSVSLFACKSFSFS